MAEIKPPIVLNFTPPAGGGASRFGIEDNTSDVNRTVAMGGHNFTFDNAGNVQLTSGTISGAYGRVYSGLGLAGLNVQGESGNDYTTVDVSPGDINLGASADGSSISTNLDIYNNAFSFRMNDGAGQTPVIIKFENLPTYSDNTAALSALGGNVVYRNGDDLKITH